MKLFMKKHFLRSSECQFARLKKLIQSGLTSAATIIFLLATGSLPAAQLNPFVAYLIDSQGNKLTNITGTISAWPPTNYIVGVGTNLVLNNPSTPIQVTTDTNGFMSNNLTAGNYRLQFAGFSHGVTFGIVNSTNVQNLAQVGGMPVVEFANFTLAQFSDAGSMAYQNTQNWVTNTQQGVSNALGYMPTATNFNVITNLLGGLFVPNNSNGVVSALGIVPAAKGYAGITNELHFAPLTNTAAGVIGTLGYIPAASNYTCITNLLGGPPLFSNATVFISAFTNIFGFYPQGNSSNAFFSVFGYWPMPPTLFGVTNALAYLPLGKYTGPFGDVATSLGYTPLSQSLTNFVITSNYGQIFASNINGYVAASVDLTNLTVGTTTNFATLDANSNAYTEYLNHGFVTNFTAP